MKIQTKTIEVYGAIPLLNELAEKIAQKFKECGNGWIDIEAFEKEGMLWSANTSVEAEFESIEGGEKLTDLAVVIWAIDCTDVEGNPVAFELLDGKGAGIGDDELKVLVDRLVRDFYL